MAPRRSPMIRLALAASLGGLAAASIAGCIFFSDFDGLEGGASSSSSSGSGGTGGEAPDAGPDVQPPPCTDNGGALETHLPEVAPGFRQVYDGDASDTCSLPLDHFILTKQGKFRSFCKKAPQWLDDANVDADIRAGWATDGIHLSFVVRKSTAIVVDPAQSYHGDAIEIFLKDPNSDVGIFHDIFSLVPDAGQSGAGLTDAKLALNEGGYTLELRVPWGFITGDAKPLQVGAPLLFDFILGTADPSTDPEADAGNHFSAAFCYPNDDAGNSCKPDGAVLADDPGSWCPLTLTP